MERKVIVIAGPTCSGKTKLGILLGKKLKTEIISADSRQVYKFLNIGTAKPTPEELKKVKHHFIADLFPDEVYNVSRFESDALSIIGRLHKKNKIPVVVGGSGLYIKAVVDGIFDSVDTDPEFRKKMNEKRNEFGNLYLYEELKKVDPVSAKNMLPQNWKRVMRALEVYHLSGKPIWELQKEHVRESDADFYLYGLNWERSVLYKNIEKRVDNMIDAGLVSEVKALLAKGYEPGLNSLNTVGYKEIVQYLRGKIDLETAVSLIKRNTRRFAKRQLTWFRKDNRIKWIDVENEKDFGKAAELIYDDITL